MSDLPLAVALRVDAVCGRFEAAWQKGASPRIEDFIADAPPEDRQFLLRELIPIDAYHLGRRGDDPRAADYRGRFPEVDPTWLENAIHAPEGGTQPSRRDITLDAQPPTPTGEYITLPDPAAISGYEFLGVLGRGGMGVVYRARHIQLDRIVALKMVSGPGSGEPNALRRFLREMRATARLSHPNIVTVYDAGEAGGLPYFTMEHLHGTDLAALVRMRGPLPVDEACDYVRQAALGLQHALDRNLIHRDVKPGNLFLVAGGVIKVLDLGLARMLPDAAGPATPDRTTWEGTVLGTPDFVAPEQLVDASSVDTRADLYSLGCTLYALLAGRAPYPSGSPAEKMAKHLSAEEPRPIESFRADIPLAVTAILKKLLAKRREDRYQTPGELAAALSALLTVSAPVPHVDSRKPGLPTASRRRFVAGSLAVLLVVALGLIGWQVWRPQPEPSAEPLQVGASAGIPVPVTPPSITNPTTQPEDFDRRAAAILLPHKFEVSIRFSGGTERTLMGNDLLPDERFALVGVKVEPGDPFDADFVQKTFLPAVSQLQQLVEIRDYGGRMTWTEDELDRLARSLAGAAPWRFESHVPFTPRSLAALKKLPRLTTVQVSGRYAGDAMLGRLKGELPNLISLRLDRLGDPVPVTEQGWSTLTALPLKSLSLFAPKEFDLRIAERVARMPNLESFWIWTETLPLDDLIVTLASAPNLWQLAAKSRVTDAGLANLEAAPNVSPKLVDLDLVGNKGVTPGGIEKLSKVLPRCQMRYGPWDNVQTKERTQAP